jgi:hypothetical protein
MTITIILNLERWDMAEPDTDIERKVDNSENETIRWG